MDGIDVLKRIKADERTRIIPVVMVTSSAEGRDITESYKLGVNSYVVKPVDFEQFSDAVAKAGFYWMLMNKTPDQEGARRPANMSRQLKILFLEDVPTDAELELRELQKGGIACVTQRVETKEEFIRMLAEFQPDVVLSDFSLPGFDGLSALAIARERRPDTPFIFVSGTIGEERAIETLKDGAIDYVLKTNLKRLVPVVRRALQDAEARAARRRAEQQVAAQREFYRNVIDLDRNFIFAKDREGRFTLANQALADFYGCPVDYPLGKTYADINPDPERAEHIRKVDLEVMNTLREVFIPEERITDAAGRVRWLQTVKRPLVSADGTANMVLGIATDITERKRNEEALRESEYRLDLALQASNLATWDWNLATGDVRLSRHWWRVLGYGPDEISLRVEAWEKLTHPEDLLRVKSMLAAQVKGSLPVLDVEYRMRAKSGEWRWIRTVGRVVERDAAGRALRMTGTHGDITERKLQERKIARLSRIQAVLSGINATIVRVRDRDELFRDACRIAVEHGGFGLAWIGLVEEGTGRFRIAAWQGEHADYIDVVSTPRSARPEASRGRGTTERVLAEKRPVICNDIGADPDITVKAEALKRGFRSLAKFPLMVSDEVTGVLALYASEVRFFDDEEMKLLGELAGDISFALDHIEKAERLDYLAYYDSLTDVPNRSLFRDRLELALAHARRRGELLGVIVINIDRFKKINESLGTDAGDELLRNVASRLQASLREVDTIARLGGNEYAVLVEGVMTGAEVILVADKLAQALDAPFGVRGHEVFVSASTGIAVYQNGASDPQVLLQSAESAMRRVKQEGGGGYQLYDEQPSPQSAQRLELESRLRHALENGELAVHYQAKVNLLTGTVTGAEALLRWNHPELGLISPAQFVPIAEETGLIIPIGAWVLRAACAQTAAWHRADYPIEIAVNLSPRQFRDKNLVNTVAAALTESGLPAEHLELEITEGTAMSHAEHTVTVLGELHALGLKLAVDDFGTGYSSLSYLKRFPLDCLKIDRSFVSDIGNDPNSEAIVPATVALAHSLKLKVVAEGIETAVQRDFLASAGCNEGQGYLYSRPLPAAEFGALLGAARYTPLAWGA